MRVSGRHIEVTEAMERQIREHAAKLPRFDSQIQHLQVTLSEDAGMYVAEAIAKCHRVELVAEAKSHDMYESIDEVFAKMARQVARHHDRLVNNRGRPG